MMALELAIASIQAARFVDLAYAAAIVILILIASNFWWNLLRRMAFDAVTIYAAAVTARQDGNRQRAELEMWQRRGMAAIKDRRAMLQTGSAAMWKTGAYDIELEEANKWEH